MSRNLVVGVVIVLVAVGAAIYYFVSSVDEIVARAIESNGSAVPGTTVSVSGVRISLRAALAARGAWANIQPMPRQKTMPAFSPFFYRYRHLVERFFNRIKHFRGLATRYDRRPDNFHAALKLVAIRIWLSSK